MGWDTVFLHFIITRIEHTAINREIKIYDSPMNFIWFFSSFYRLLKNETPWPDAFTPCYSPGSWIKSILLFHPKRIPPGVWELNIMSIKIVSFYNMLLSEILFNKISLIKMSFNVMQFGVFIQLFEKQIIWNIFVTFSIVILRWWI